MTLSELDWALKMIDRLANSPAVRGLDAVRATKKLGEMIRPIVAAQPFGEVVKRIGELRTAVTVLAE
jgi:hypothetical protein